MAMNSTDAILAAFDNGKQQGASPDAPSIVMDAISSTSVSTVSEDVVKKAAQTKLADTMRISAEQQAEEMSGKLSEAVITRTAETAIATEAMQKTASKVSGAQEAVIAGMTASADLDRIIQEAALASTLKAENATNAAFEASGGSAAQVERFKAAKAASDEKLAALDYNQKAVSSRLDPGEERLGFWDNVAAQWDIGMNQQRVDVATAAEAGITNTITAMNAALTGTAQVNNLTKRTVTDATIKASLDKLGSDANVQIEQQKMNNALTNADLVGKIYAMDGEKLANAKIGSDVAENALSRIDRAEDRVLRKQQIELQQEQMEMARMRFDEEKAGAPLRARLQEIAMQEADLKEKEIQRSVQLFDKATDVSVGELDARLVRAEQITNPKARELEVLKVQGQIDAISQTKAQRAAKISTIQEGQAMLGMTPYTPEQVDNIYASGSAKAIEAMQTFAEMSMSKQFGGTPWKAFKNLELVDPTGNMPPNAGTRLLEATMAELTRVGINGEVSGAWADGVPKDEYMQAAQFNRVATALAMKAAANIDPKDMNNPNQAPPMESLAGMQAVKESPLYKEVLSKKGMDDVDPTMVVVSALEGLEAGVINSTEAATGIVTLFKASVAYNDAMNYGLAGVGVTPNAKYNATIDKSKYGITRPKATTADIFATGLVQSMLRNRHKTTADVDLTDFTAVQALLVEMRSVKQRMGKTSPSE